MQGLMQRVGTLEVSVAKLQVSDNANTKAIADHEPRIRKSEYLIAKIIGACLAGSALGHLVLSKLTGCTGG